MVGVYIIVYWWIFSIVFVILVGVYMYLRCYLVIVNFLEKSEIIIVCFFIFFKEVIDVNFLLYVNFVYILFVIISKLCLIIIFVIVCSFFLDSEFFVGLLGEYKRRVFVLFVMIFLICLGCSLNFVFVVVLIVIGIFFVSEINGL